ncbi:DNA replication ATP-dependent helicase/nuclease DNA2-like [Eriocheir sinensis]|uniref:DNA replication ATP-dependent helicase/nuclease DNA2-like n=1 Tax=Eriocheir sinensis TaxID=95602 RepID=UPI0021C9777B|nr:DNA replication ATP-dependent helicase/nuclease DNA2-like [Eriocheir sinensis]XP_050717883.1 DNA replication ATP-dependent helicase/nuclease DNA2-like [Eriocheir sinensis]XP_050717884.1 DNA replication ATP-dependent helicase/nuclease DNA2-like [Eriocheir sinensis]
MVKSKASKSVQPHNQKKITSFFSCVPLKREPDHNGGVSPDPKRSNSSTATAATSGGEQNLEPCTKNLSQRLGSGPSKLSLGRPRSVLKEKSQVCSDDSDVVFVGDGGTRTQTKKSSPAAAPKTKSGKEMRGKGKRKGSENVPGRGSIASLFKLRLGSESKLGSGKPTHRKVVEVYLSDSSADDAGDDDKLNRARKEEEEEEEEDEFPDSTPDLRDKYDCGKLIIGKAEGEFTSDSEGSPEKLQKINKAKEEKDLFMTLDSEDLCTNEAVKTTTKGEEVKKVLTSPRHGVSGINRLGKTRKIEEEEDTIEALMLIDKEDTCTRIESGKVSKEKAEEERAFILSDLSEDLFDSPQKNKDRLSHRKIQKSLKRADKIGTATDTTKQESDSGTSSEDESTPDFLACSQGFHLKGKDETDRTSKKSNKPQNILKLQMEEIFYDESLGMQSQEESIELFPEVTAALREANTRNKTQEAANDILEDSPMMELTQKATSDVPSNSEDARLKESLPGTLRMKINGNGTLGTPEVDGDDTPASPSFKIDWNGTPEKKHKGANSPGTLKLNGDDAPIDKLNHGGTPMDVVSSDDSPEAEINGDDISCTPDGIMGGDGLMEAKIDDDEIPSTPDGIVNGDAVSCTPDGIVNGDGLTEAKIGDAISCTPDGIMDGDGLTEAKINGDEIPSTPDGIMNGDGLTEARIDGDEIPCTPDGIVDGDGLREMKVNGEDTAESKMNSDNIPGTPISETDGGGTIESKIKSYNIPGTPNGKTKGGGTVEAKIDNIPGTPKGNINGGGSPESKIKSDNIPGTPNGKINGGGTPESKVNVGTLGTHSNTPRTPKNKGAKGEATGKLSRQEEMDCLNILEMFEEMSPFKQKPSESRTVPRLLRDDPTVRKFLAEGGQGEETYAAQGNFGRHLVLAVERDTASRKTELELVSPENVRRTCTLAGMWSDTVIRDGDIIHILLTDPVDNHYHIDNNQGLVVVHPDLLLSSTTVVSGVFCRRRAVLSHWHRETDSNMVMLVGTLVHELFQEAVVDAAKGGLGQLTEGKLRTMIDRLVCRRNVFRDLYCLGRTLQALKEEMVGFIPRVQAWCHRYLGRGRQGMAGGSYKWPGKVVAVQDVEENIWSPRFGLKGKIDMVVRVEGPGGPATLPLELKTGRASFSADHRGQLALYAMMASDRRPDPGVGLLLYLREGAMEGVTAPARERRDLLCLRNELAQHLTSRPEVTGEVEPPPLLLPPPIDHERGCQKCPHLVTCATHQVLRGEVPPDPHPMASLVPQHTAHLSPQHLEYFRHWCLLMQLEAGEELGGGRALWCRGPVHREGKGECLAWLVVASPPPVEVQPGAFLHTLVRGSRHPGPAPPLASVGLHTGDMVVASSTTALALAAGTIQGFSGGAVLVELERPLPAGPAHHYHLDLFQYANSCRVPMLSLGRLMLPEPRSEALRRLVVDRAAPTFRKRLPRKVLDSAPLMKHLNTEQRRAVLSAASAEDFLLVEGFPGTGKSSTVAALVQVLLLLGRSVLLTAYTNSALDSLLLKLHAKKVDFMRLGRAHRIHPDLAGHTEEARTGQVTSVEQLAEAYDSQRVVAATCLGLTHALFTRCSFDVCILDEAAQVLQATALAPLFLSSSFVLVGDAHQLPPLIRSSQATLWGMAETMFERLQCPEATITLSVQYRMNGPIMALANTLTYQGLLRCGSQDLKTATPALPHYQALVEAGEVSPWLQRVVAPTLEASVVMVDTAGQAGESQASGKTLANQREAWLSVMVVKALLKAGLSADDVGIIAPYRGQVRLVKAMLEKDTKEEEKGERKEKEGQGSSSKVEVNTVDQYQGRDKTVIICTFVRCGNTDAKASGILTDRRRLNVALTRAKRKLILIGDVTTLSHYHPFSCLLNALTPQQVYKLAPGTDGFSWKEEEVQDA